MEKGSKISRDQDRRNSSLKDEVVKQNHPVWDSNLSGFYRTDRVQLRLEI
jgi:hypothetical protein